MFKSTDFFNNWYEYYQRYVLIFNLIVVISLLPFGWIYIEFEQGGIQPFFQNPWMQGVGILLMGAVGVWQLHRGYFGTRVLIRQIDKSATVKNKLRRYYEFQMRKFVRYELIAVLCILGMLLFHMVFFAIFYLFIIFLFSLDWPKYTKVVQHLRLNKEEQAQLESIEPLI